jgi:hypothetical protein
LKASSGSRGAGQSRKVGHATQACSFEREFNTRFDIDDPMALKNVQEILRVVR